jgi:hypothetical protein
VQLIGTAHGRTLENLLLNPTLSDLVGGIESVTLSDEEARRRGTQKTVLERRSPPTFDVLIEIQDRDRLSVHPDVAAAVDTLVRGAPPQPEIRYRDQAGEIHFQKPAPLPNNRSLAQGLRRSLSGNLDEVDPYTVRKPGERRPGDRREPQIEIGEGEGLEIGTVEQTAMRTLHVYAYGVARNRLTQAAKRLGVPAVMVRELAEADALITLRTYYRNREQSIMEAEQRGLPIYALRSNTVSQIEQSLVDMFNLPTETPDNAGWEQVTSQTQTAIESVLNGQRWVDLPPASASIRRIQHDLARQAQLVSHSYGKEPNRRVRIFRE